MRWRATVGGSTTPRAGSISGQHTRRTTTAGARSSGSRTAASSPRPASSTAPPAHTTYASLLPRRLSASLPPPNAWSRPHDDHPTTPLAALVPPRGPRMTDAADIGALWERRTSLSENDLQARRLVTGVVDALDR